MSPIQHIRMAERLLAPVLARYDYADDQVRGCSPTPIQVASQQGRTNLADWHLRLAEAKLRALQTDPGEWA